MGDKDLGTPWPANVDRKKVDAAVEAAFDPAGMTGAFVVTYKGRIIGERYGPNVTKDTPDPVGGTIDRDKDGNPTGVMKERATGLIRAGGDLASGERLVSFEVKPVGEVIGVLGEVVRAVEAGLPEGLVIAGPDADALGAALALQLILVGRGGEASVVSADLPSQMYDVIPSIGRVVTEPPAWAPDAVVLVGGVVRVPRGLVLEHRHHGEVGIPLVDAGIRSARVGDATLQGPCVRVQMLLRGRCMTVRDIVLPRERDDMGEHGVSPALLCHIRPANDPPSTLMCVPVMNFACSLHMNVAIAPKSPASPIVPLG